MSKKQIGRVVLQQRAVSSKEFNQALAEQAGAAGGAPHPAAGGSAEEEVVLLKALSERFGIPGIDLSQLCLKLSDLELLPREIAEKHLILPVLVRNDRLFIAMANPSEKKVIDELEFVTGKKVYPYVALEGALKGVIAEAYSLRSRGEGFYIGPRCPAEVLQRAGLGDRVSTPAPAMPTRPSAPAPAASHAESQFPPDAHQGRNTFTPAEALPLEIEDDAPGLVLDDTLGRAYVDQTEDDVFGDLSRELSVVTDIPEEQFQGSPAAKTILVVDDEPEIRHMLSRLLSSKGYRVLEVDRGLAALRMVKEHRPDLIILDAMLPEVHGFDIARRIKGSQRYGGIPIIMISAVYRGWHYAEDLRQACGVEFYIEKPFRLAQVTEAVEKALSGRSPEEDAQEISAEAEEELNAGVAAYKEGRIDEAMAHLKRGIGIDPLAYRLHFHLGLLYGKKRMVYEAISELVTAIEINSKHFPAVKNLAILYQKAGFKNKATETWGRALSLAPDEETRSSIKEHLVSLF